MSDAYEQLKTIACNPEFSRIVVDRYAAMHTTGLPKMVCMTGMIDRLTSKFGLMADEVAYGSTAVVLYLTGSRAAQPACLVVSENTGQMPSPSAMFVFSGDRHMIQIFEGDADDSGMDNPSASVAYWVESKGRSLQC